MLTIPTKCPVCSSTLVRVNDQLFCQNTSCDAKSFKKLLHFIKTMKIKGLGEKTLEKLDNVESITDLYKLSIEELKSTLGEKIGTKIYNEITQSKEVNLATFIQSFGIHLIGNSASTKLALHTDSLWDIDNEVCSKAGLGTKATESLIEWIQANRDTYEDMPISFKQVSRTITAPAEPLCKVCITGKLNTGSRATAKEYLTSVGCTVVGTVSSKVDYLICDQGNTGSSSCTKAEKLNIPIITYEELLNKLNIKEII